MNDHTLNPELNPERERLEQQHEGREDWRLWGPYLAERAWGTVREDYSPYGSAWEDFDHDQARSRAYRWNEDGLGGISDEQQYKYPQTEYPYAWLVDENRRPGRSDPAFNLLDTGAFSESRYWDVDIRCAKATPE